MPYDYFIDTDLRTGLVVVTGHADPDLFNEATDAMMSDRAWRPDFTSVWDLSQTEAVDVTPNGVDDLVARKLQREKEMGLSGDIAIVLNRTTLEGIAELAKYLASTSSRRIEVFSDVAEALAWLGLPPGRDPRVGLSRRDPE